MTALEPEHHVTSHAPDEFDVDVDRQGERAVVVVRGDVDVSTAGSLDAAMRDIDAPEVVVDCSHVTFLDSTGLRVLLSADNAARQRGGRLVVRAPSSQVARVLDVSGLIGALAVEP